MVINSGRTKDRTMLRTIREMAYIAVQYNFQIRAVYLAGIRNRRADILSRAHLNPGMEARELVDSSWNKCELTDSIFELRESW